MVLLSMWYAPKQLLIRMGDEYELRIPLLDLVAWEVHLWLLLMQACD